MQHYMFQSSKANWKEIRQTEKHNVLGCIYPLCKCSVFLQYILQQIFNSPLGNESHYNFLKQFTTTVWCSYFKVFKSNTQIVSLSILNIFFIFILQSTFQNSFTNPQWYFRAECLAKWIFVPHYSKQTDICVSHF